jgi:hypothetical protein
MPGELTPSQLSKQLVSLNEITKDMSNSFLVMTSSHDIVAGGGAPADDVTIYNANFPGPVTPGLHCFFCLFYPTAGAGTVQLRKSAGGGGGAPEEVGPSLAIAPGSAIALCSTEGPLQNGESLFLRRSNGTTAGKLVVFWIPL